MKKQNLITWISLVGIIGTILYGIASWLIIEASFSLYYGIYINVGVDLALMISLCLPLVIAIRSKA